MYELGVRHITAKCTIQIGEKGRLPFDVSTIRTVQFKRTPNGLITARNKLGQMIGNVLANGCAPTTAARIIGLHVGGSRSSDDGPEPERSYAGEPEPEPEPPDAELEAPMGLLEAQVELEDGLPDLGQRISLMGELIERIAALTNGYSPKVSQAVKPAQRLGLMASYARELEPLAKEFDNESVEFDARVSSVGLAVRTMLEHLEVDRDVEGAKEFVDGLVGMAQGARSAHDEGMSVFRSSLDKVVGLSRELRPVVQLLARAVDRTMDDLQHVIAWGDRAAAIALVLGAAGGSEERTS